MARIAWWLLAASCTVAVSSCFGRGAFTCFDHTQCNSRTDGRCEESGYCSYPDGTCPSRRAYDDLAGSLANACVDAAEDTSTGGSTTEIPDDDTGELPPVCADHDGDGFGDGVDCAAADCDDDNPFRWDDCSYLSPAGSDDAAGTRDAPWRSFERAIPALKPGDSLVLLDGEYASEATGLPVIDCSPTGNAVSGLGPAQPISIRANDERRAVLRSNGSSPAFTIIGCAFWNITGLVARGNDLAGGTQTVFSIQQSQNLGIRRGLVSHGNRYTNSSVMTVSNSSAIVIEEVEAYAYPRHGFSVYESERVTLRRCYVNAQQYPDLDGCSVDPSTPYCSQTSAGGDTGVTISRGAHNTVENCVFDDRLGEAVSVSASSDNRILGSVALESVFGVVINGASGIAAARNRLENVVVARASSVGIYLRSTGAVQVDGATLLQNGNTGLLSNELSDEPCAVLDGGCSFEARHVLALGNANHGVRGEAPTQWSAAHSNAFGNQSGEYAADEPIDDDAGLVRHSLAEPVGDIGFAIDQCAVFVPAGSTMKGRGEAGADVGANVLYRYEDGEITTVPLWDPESGSFPCGAIVPGINDDPAHACVGVHQRLNVGVNGCALPDEYGEAAAAP